MEKSEIITHLKSWIVDNDKIMKGERKGARESLKRMGAMMLPETTMATDRITILCDAHLMHEFVVAMMESLGYDLSDEADRTRLDHEIQDFIRKFNK